MKNFNITTNSPQETIDFGRRFGSQLRGGEVIALCGPLGSGKTHLIKGIVKGLDAEGTVNEVTSPTFVLVNEYAGRLDIFHIDAYRLDSIAQFEQIGFDDYCYPGSVVLIEWADKIEKALAGINYIKVELAHISPSSRAISIKDAPDYIKF
ncbi:MAG: tRNA (adenosine(37)-N6)-threonylcarbamoyltransferase complex ATPase subunit type 1 TsaE [Sedimentisphaerales bacterium]